MINDFDISMWLKKHSISMSEFEQEITYSHVGDTSSSLIKPVSGKVLLKVKNHNLSKFYETHFGGHFDNSQLMIPTIIKGGFEINDEWHLPDQKEAKSRARKLGVKIPKDEDIIIIGAGWMFFYTVTREETPSIKFYDRDFGTVNEEESIQSIFERSWDILANDL